jgi:hypothetical protein
MRVFYLDPGLKGDVGHHANYCRYIVGELRARGIETGVFGYEAMDSALQSELGAIPHFRVYTYLMDDDPAAGWLLAFDTSTQMTLKDLGRLPRTEPGDIVFMNSAQPAQLAAMLMWQGSLAAGRRPAAVVEIGESGLDVKYGLKGYEWHAPDPRLDPRAALFRFATKRLPAAASPRLHIVAFDGFVAEVLSALLARSIGVLPLPYPAVTRLRNRAGARPITVAIPGHQRVGKGYELLPEIARRLLSSRADIRLLIQLVEPQGPHALLEEMRDLAVRCDRLTIEERPAGRTLWAELMERSDLVLCPYPPAPYAASISSVAAEALANGIPLVAPAGTTMERWLKELRGPGTAFHRFEPAAIVAATEQALDGFEGYATRAYEAAVAWPLTRGPARTVDGLLTLI